MQTPFFRYFAAYIFRAKTRQRLLFLALAGLAISSFALLVLQSVMGGLQKKVVERSKAVMGEAVIWTKFRQPRRVLGMAQLLREEGLLAVPEYQAEMLLKAGPYLAPVVVHALSPSHPRPTFLEGRELDELILSEHLASHLNVGEAGGVRLINPAQVDDFIGDVPRTVSLYVSSLLSTQVPQIDRYHVWVAAQKMHNLIRERAFNAVRIHTPFKEAQLKSRLDKKYWGEYRLLTWEEQNRTLVWALKLENMMMLFLFTGMTVLVGLCVTSALMLFLDKIKTDLASFWVLGADKKKLEHASQRFLQIVGIASIVLGMSLAAIFLWGLHHWGGDLMPAVFVERKIPVSVRWWGVLSSFFIPYAISTFFGQWVLRTFRRDTNYLKQVRTLNA